MEDMGCDAIASSAAVKSALIDAAVARSEAGVTTKLMRGFTLLLPRPTAFAGAGYRLNGSSYQPGILRLTDAAIAGTLDETLGATYVQPEPIRIYDTAQTSVGFSFAASDSVAAKLGRDIPLQLGLMYDWQQNAVAGIADTHELIPFLSLEWSDRVRIGPYLVIGLSKPAPDVGIAAQISVNY